MAAHTSRDQCELVVQDTGPGIAPDVLPHIFEPFFRAPGSSTSGHGIGLATVQRILKASEGEVLVESVVGVGTPLVPTPRQDAANA